MSISREKFESEGMLPEIAKEKHMEMVRSIRLGHCIDLSTWAEAQEFCMSSPIDRTEHQKSGEDFVKQAVALVLEDEGWEDIDIKWGSEHGPDIQGNRGVEHVVVEAKGIMDEDPAIQNYSLRSIGQIVIYREKATWESILAFPALTNYVKHMRKLPPWFLSAMNLRVFLVKNEKGIYSVARLRII